MIIQTTKELRPRDPHDFYPTPLALCEAALALIPLDIRNGYKHRQEFIVDPCAGTGVWGVAARKRWPDAYISGCDIRDIPQPNAYDHWLPKWDFIHQAVGGNADVVMSNPPYKFAEEFTRKSIRFLDSGGYHVSLMRLAFLEGQARGTGLWRDLPPLSVHVLSRRPSFITEGKNKGKTDATAYALYIWREGYKGKTELNWLDWNPEPVSDTQQISMFDVIGAQS